VTRYLIVNADDLGLCAAVNAGVVAAHDHGIVTSASLMVRFETAAAAAELAAARPALSLGLHVDLGEWEPAADGGWTPRYQVVDTTDRSQVTAEIERQLALFEQLTGASPTHLDGHQHVQREEPCRSVLRAIAGERNIPLRLNEPTITFCGGFYGQAYRGVPYPDGIGVDNLVQLIRALPSGWSELGCHPGLGTAADLTSYATERDTEVATLCRAELGAALASAGVELRSFADFAAQRRTCAGER